MLWKIISFRTWRVETESWDWDFTFSELEAEQNWLFFKDLHIISAGVKILIISWKLESRLKSSQYLAPQQWNHYIFPGLSTKIWKGAKCCLVLKVLFWFYISTLSLNKQKNKYCYSLYRYFKFKPFLISFRKENLEPMNSLEFPSF